MLNTGVLTGGGNPTADFLPGMLVHLLIPYPRVFVMMTVLGMPVWAMISSHDPRWNAWQLLPVGRVTIERRAIRGLLLLGLVFAVLDLTGAVATLALRPPTHWFAPPSGLQPAIFGMLLTPIAAAASHVLFLRRGERGATPTALALLTGAWLVGYLLIATNGLATVALGVTGLDLRQLGTLSDPAVVIILLFPSLVIAAVAWMAWLVGTQLVWRLR